jgi:hypothetical protein
LKLKSKYIAFIRHLIKVPQLPHEVRDQFNAVEIVEYLTREKESVKEGQPIVRVKTWWAVLDILSTVKGRIEKNFYDNPAIKSSRIGIGEPLQLVFSDPDDLIGLKSEPFGEIKVVQILREKPNK